MTFERVLARMADIKISTAHHGSIDDRHYDYDPTFLVRGLKQLHIEFTPLP